MQDVEGDGDRGEAHNAKVGQHFLGAECIAETTQQQEIIEVKVDAEQQHEYADDDFKVRVIVRPHAESLVAETAGARRAEGVDERVEHRHAACAEQNDLDEGHGEVDGIQNLRTIA